MIASNVANTVDRPKVTVQICTLSPTAGTNSGQLLRKTRHENILIKLSLLTPCGIFNAVGRFLQHVCVPRQKVSFLSPFAHRKIIQHRQGGALFMVLIELVPWDIRLSHPFLAYFSILSS